jgi:hypothetical protein
MYRGPFPGDKARPRRDADHSHPSSAEVENECELYFLSQLVSAWRVAGQLYFTFLDKKYIRQNAMITEAV